jgi:putative salt-induced outer membrane protein YdiY
LHNLPPTRPRRLAVLPGAALFILLSGAAQAQVTLKPDGEWRSLFTLAANATSGNSRSSNLNLGLEAARVTTFDKWVLRAQVASARNAGTVTTERYLGAAQYNRDFSADWFGFGSGDFLRDELANVGLRSTLASGIGRHMVQSERHTFDLSAGLAYTQDQYENPALVDGVLRDSYGRAELLLAEESNHKLTDTTSLRQKFALYPNLRDSGQRRAVFDSQISVAMTKSLNLTAGLSVRYNSDPGLNLKKTDTALVTGVSWRFD